MKNKYFKVMSIIAVALLTVVLGNGKVEAVTQSQFTLDYAFHYTLPDELTPGYNDIIINTAERLKSKDNKELNDKTEYIINYKLTEVDKDYYEKFKTLQDQIFTESNIRDGLTVENQTITEFQNLVRAKYNDEELWCYNKPTTGRIKVEANCETKYYVLTVDVEAKDVKVDSYGWEYMTAKAYEVKADKTVCPKCKIVGNKYYDSEGNEIAKAEYEKACPKGNPSTGVNTPYIILGSVALGAALIVLISKKKKFI